MADKQKYNKNYIRDYNVQGKLGAIHQLDEYMQAKHFNKNRNIRDEMTGKIIGSSSEAPTDKHFLQWMEEDYSVGRQGFKERDMPFLSAFFDTQQGRDLVSSYEDEFIKMKKEGKIKKGTPAYYQFSEEDYESHKDKFLNLPDWSPKVSEESKMGTGTKTIEDRIMKRMQIIDEGGLF
tara:strand:+ start:133 stop:666 length:534 start_codon:yes stop_codon:yes gene_type:complete